MIPSIAGFLNRDFQIREKPGFTYRMHKEEHLVCGCTDGLEAVKQAVYKILMTERSISCTAGIMAWNLRAFWASL